MCCPHRAAAAAAAVQWVSLSRAFFKNLIKIRGDHPSHLKTGKSRRASAPSPADVISPDERLSDSAAPSRRFIMQMEKKGDLRGEDICDGSGEAASRHCRVGDYV